MRKRKPEGVGSESVEGKVPLTIRRIAVENSPYHDDVRPWKAWAWPAIFVATLIAMTFFGTEALPGNERDLWVSMAAQAFAITGIVAIVKTWGYGPVGLVAP